MRRLKDAKAMEKDGVSEAWKYDGVEMEKWVWEICKRV